MPANVDAMIREGLRALKAGNKSEARALLEKAVESDSYNEQAWLWLSATVDTEEEQRTCLENVLVINPDNERAQQGLAALEGGGTVTPDDEVAPAAPPPPEPRTGTPFVDDSYDDGYEVEAGSVEWGSDAPAEPPPPRQPRGASLTSDDYDDWISNMALDQQAESKAADPASPFSDFDTGGSSGAAFTMDDRAALFGSDDLDDEFDDDDLFDDDTGMSQGPFASNVIEDDPVYDEPPAPASRPPAEPMLSPVTEHTGQSDSDFLADLEGESGDFFFPDEDGSGDSAAIAAEPDDYFSQIPADIQATRLPGTVEGTPMPAIIGLVVLAVLNLGALVWLAMRLSG